jgi:hypothetical protein
MAGPNDRGWNQPELWVEAFATLNIAFLTFDIFLAHSVNQFRSRAEYIPLLFSATAPVFLIIGLTQRRQRRWVWKFLGYVTGWIAIGVGLTGVILHLESHFFYERTIRSLTYSAPFAAPLAYAGLGFLLLMNRMVEAEKVEWAHWIIFFTLGGFVGNFVFSLADHAQNGFFFRIEWLPVIASAIAVGFLCVPLLMPVSRLFLDLSAVVLVLEAGVGFWGFLLHSVGNLRGPSIRAFDNFVYGAPPLAPLLFPNLMALGMIGLWQLRTGERASKAKP